MFSLIPATLLPSSASFLLPFDQRAVLSIAFAQGMFEEALTRYSECLAIRKEEVGENHPDVAAVLSSMGEALVGQVIEVSVDIPPSKCRAACANPFKLPLFMIQRGYLGVLRPESEASPPAIVGPGAPLAFRTNISPVAPAHHHVARGSTTRQKGVT